MSQGKVDIGRHLSQDRMDHEDGLSWRKLIGISSAKTRKIRGSNYVQLATASSAPTDGNPAAHCRTVVFRGFESSSSLPAHLVNECEGDSTVMRMITDARSQKYKQEQHSNVELLWWFPKTTEQYRVQGDLIYVGDDSTDDQLRLARKQMWGNLSDSAREQFFDIRLPGASFQEMNDVGIPAGGRDLEGKVLTPPSHFLLMLLYPKRVDYLRLQNMYRQVDERLEDGSWSWMRVNP